MIRKPALFTLASLTVLPAACSDGATTPFEPALSAVSTARADAAFGELPLRITGYGSLEPIGWCDEAAGVLRFLVTGTGVISHVGRVTTEQVGCRSMVTGAVTGVEATFVAANGDQLYATASGQAVDPTTMIGAIDAVYTVTGGTGRFIGAEGSVDVVITMISETDWTATGSGWISYEANNRSNR